MSFKPDEQYDRIYRYCFFKVNNKEIAEDLTQETFLRYFAQTSYISKGKPLAYLYTIAKNLCTDHYRKAVCVPLDDELADQDEMSAFETSIALRQAVESLPQELQEMLLLRYANELSIGELARLTKLSRFAVYRKLKLAQDKLQKIVTKEDFS